MSQLHFSATTYRKFGKMWKLEAKIFGTEGFGDKFFLVKYTLKDRNFLGNNSR